MTEIKQMTAEEYRQQYDAGNIQLTPQTAQMDSAQAYRERYEQDNPPEAKPGVVTPVVPVGQPMQPKNNKSKYPDTLQGHISETIEPLYNFVGNEWEIGMEGMHESEEGFAAFSGKQTYEQAEANLATSKAKMGEAQKKVQAFRDTSAAYNAVATLGDATVQNLPYLVHLAGAYGAGFGVGAGAGAIGGVATAAPTGEVIAPITVPAGALAAGALAGKATSTVWASAMATGYAYKKYRDMGLPDAQARVYATGEGIQQGVFLNLRGASLAGSFKGAVLEQAKAHVGNFLKRYAETVGTQTLFGVAQSTQTQLMETMAAYTSGKKGLVPTFKQSIDRIVEAVKTSFVQAAALSAAAEGGAKVVKHVWKPPTTVPEYLAVKSQMANNPNAKLADLPPPVIVEEVKAEVVKPEPVESKDTRSKSEIARDERAQQLKEETVQARQELKDLAEQKPVRRTFTTTVSGEAEKYEELEKLDINAKQTENTVRSLEQEKAAVDARVEKIEGDYAAAQEKAKELANYYEGRAAYGEGKADVEQMKAQEKRARDLAKEKKAELEKYRLKQTILKEDLRSAQEDRTKAVSERNAAQKEALKAAVKKVENAEKAEKEHEEKSLERETAKLNSTVDTISDIKKEGGQREARYDPASRQALFDYRDFIGSAQSNIGGMIDNDKAAEFLLGEIEKSLAEQRTQDASAASPGGEPTGADYNLSAEIRKVVASDVVNYRNLDSKGIRKLNENIQNLINFGKDKRIEKKKAEYQEIKDVVTKVTENLQGEHPINPNDRNLREPHGVWHWWTRTKGETMYPWDSLMDNLFTDSLDEKAGDLLDAQPALLAEQKGIEDQQQKALNYMTGDNKKLEGRVTSLATLGTQDKYVGSNEKPHPITHELTGEGAEKYADQEGNPQALRLTDNEALQWHMDFKRPSMEQGIRDGNKFTYKDNNKNTHKLVEGEISTEELIEKNLTDEQKRIADGIMQFYADKENFKTLNDKSIDKWGLPLEPDENYTGYRSREGFDGPQEGTNEFFTAQQFAGRKSLTPKSLIPKVKSEKGYVNVDAFDNLSKVIAANEKWIHTDKADRIIRTTFRNKTVRNIIRFKKSSNSLRVIDYMYNNMFGTRGIQHVQRVTVLGTIRRNAATAFVAFKLNAVKQLSSMWNALSYIDGGQLASGTIDAILHPKQAYNLLSQTDLWKTRYAKNGAGIITEAMERKNQLGFKSAGNTVQVTMGLVTAFDKVSMLWSGNAVYKGAYEAATRKGMTPEQAHAFGLKEFEKFGNRTSSSSTPDQITFWEHGGDWHKLLALFHKSEMQNIAHGDIALRRMFSNPTPENRTRALNTVLGNMGAQVAYATAFTVPTAIAAAVGVGVAPKKRKQEVLNAVNQVAVSAMLNQVQGYPLIGDALNMALTAAVNAAIKSSVPVFEPKDLATSTAMHGGYFALDMVKLVKEKHLSTEDTFRAIEHFARSAELINPVPALGGGGVPILPVIEAAKAVMVKKKK